MTRQSRWQWPPPVDGIGEVTLSSWRYFHDFVCQRMLDYNHFIWRGQRCADWRLESTLDRTLQKVGKLTNPYARPEHLRRFQFAARGRRGNSPPEIRTENEWWAIGQHHGLATPLLDWTASPFAAAYFAFYREGVPQTSRRAIWAVSSATLQVKSDEIARNHKDPAKRPNIVELVRPMSDDNPRLVNQNGLFTRAPDGMALEAWVAQHFKGHVSSHIMLKITVPDRDRASFLRSLNRMNINHLTLFPDLYGSSRHANTELEIDKY